MAQALAKITCPNCSQPFNMPVEQVLDVQLDPSAKARLLMGQINVAACPHCGMAGAINVPFIYHDAEKELALVFMPMEAGETDLERQKLIGSLSQMVMNQMPPEQRKGYLLNPQVFLSLDSLIDRVLEAEGVTEEMIEKQKARADLLSQLLDVSTREEQLELIRENEALIDEEFFQALHTNLAQLEMIGGEDIASGVRGLRRLLFEETEVGRRLAKRSEAFEELREEPTRQKLVELLAESEDPDTRAALIAFGQPLVDYLFFQTLTQRIEATEDKKKRKELEQIRKQVLDIRDEMQHQARQTLRRRAELLRRLLETEEPALLARRHLQELDELFFNLLDSEIEAAQRREDEETANALQEVWKLTIGLIREQIPPEFALVSQIMEAESDEELKKILEKNKVAVSPPMIELLGQLEEEMRERGDEEEADRAARAQAMAREIALSAETPPPSGLEQAT